jgi:site-specific DNA recombinase
MRVAIYARVSDPKQAADDKESILGQVTHLTAECERLGWTLFDQYVDPGITGDALEERPQMVRLLSDAKQGKIEVVMVRDFDRLSRGYTVKSRILDALSASRAQVWVQGMMLDPCNPHHRYMLESIGGFAAFWKEMILQNTRRGILHQVKQGKPMNVGRQYGYRWDKTAKCVVVEEEEAKIILLLFTWYVEEGLSTYDITFRLNEMGVPSRCAGEVWKRRKSPLGEWDGNVSGKWHQASVVNILNNPAYKGEGTWGKCTQKDGIFPVRYPVIVPPDLWGQAQSLKRDRRGNGNRQVRNWLLKGMIVCSKCRRGDGSGIVWRCYTDRAHQHYYICHLNKDQRKAGRVPCRSRYLRQDKAEYKVWKKLTKFVSQPTIPMLSDVEREAERLQRQPDSDAAKRLQSLRWQLDEKDRERGRLLAMGQRGLITLDELDARMIQWQRERDALAMEIENLSNAAAWERRQATWERFSVSMREIMDKATPAERRQLLKDWNVQIVAYPDRLEGRGRIKLTPEPSSGLPSRRRLLGEKLDFRQHGQLSQVSRHGLRSSADHRRSAR